MAFNFVQLNCN